MMIILLLRSREMAQSNSLFRKVSANLKSDGITDEFANNLAKYVVRQSRKKGWHGGKPGGEGGHGGRHGKSPGGHDHKVKPVSIVDDSCMGAPITCNSNEKFRTISGQCNNLQNPYWGAMSTAFLREIPVDEYDPKNINIYLDEVDKSSSRHLLDRKRGRRPPHHGGGHHGGPGGGNTGSVFDFGSDESDEDSTCPSRTNLPSARYVSQAFHTSENISSSEVTHMLTQWGQFLDHDITLTPENEEHDCCTNVGETLASSECFPIEISSSDSWYTYYN